MRLDLLPANGEYVDLPVGDVVTEAGIRIPSVNLRLHAFFDDATGTTPTPPEQRPIVLVEHALTGDGNVTDWWADMVGPGKPIDTTKYLVLCANALGGCSGSTGPGSLDPEGGFWGSRFPGISIRDMVQAEKQMLDLLEIERVHAVIGASMGGARTLEWSLMFPDMMTAALAIAVSARASAWQIGIQSSQIRVIEADPLWHGGDYYEAGMGPVWGLGQARRIAHLTYRGELEVDERFATEPQTGENPYGKYRDSTQRFAVESYLDNQAVKLRNRFDAGSYVVLTDALNRHDVSRGRGGINAALWSSTVPTMVAGVDTDILYPFHQQEHLSRNLGEFLGLSQITSPTGHDGFLIESRQMGNVLDKFLRIAAEIANESETPEKGGQADQAGSGNTPGQEDETGKSATSGSGSLAAERVHADS